MCVPAESAVVVKVAWPALFNKVAAPSWVAPSQKITLPIVTGDDPDITVAVKEAIAPGSSELFAATRVVVVLVAVPEPTMVTETAELVLVA